LNIKQLCLTGFKLSKLPEIKNINNHLEKLDISNNLLEEIPATINKLINLTSLNLSSNKLKTIGHGIFELTKL
jgi:internalin A